MFCKLYFAVRIDEVNPVTEQFSYIAVKVWALISFTMSIFALTGYLMVAEECSIQGETDYRREKRQARRVGLLESWRWSR